MEAWWLLDSHPYRGQQHLHQDAPHKVHISSGFEWAVWVCVRGGSKVSNSLLYVQCTSKTLRYLRGQFHKRANQVALGEESKQ